MGEARRRKLQGLGPRPPQIQLATDDKIEELSEAAWQQFGLAQIQSTQAVIAGRPLTASVILEVAADANDHARQVAERGMKATPKLACRAGCSWCCSMPVDVDAGEALLIGDYLRRTRNPDEYAAALERVRRAAQQVAGLSKMAQLRARIACPLLEDNRCSVYPRRPSGCMGFTSYDAAACEDAYRTDDDGSRNSLPIDPRILYSTRAVSIAAIGALHRAGGPLFDPLEFTLALRIAMDRPDAAEAWLHGEPVFAEARRANQPAQ